MRKKGKGVEAEWTAHLQLAHLLPLLYEVGRLLRLVFGGIGVAFHIICRTPMFCSCSPRNDCLAGKQHAAGQPHLIAQSLPLSAASRDATFLKSP